MKAWLSKISFYEFKSQNTVFFYRFFKISSKVKIIPIKPMPKTEAELELLFVRVGPTQYLESSQEYYVSKKNIALIYEDDKLIKTVTEPGRYWSASKNIIIFDKSDKTIHIRRYKFRTKDFNALNLDICLELRFENLEKVACYTVNSGYHFHYNSNYTLAEMFEVLLVKELEIILKKYTRAEYFTDKNTIIQELKNATFAQIYDISGYEIKDLFIFELRN